MLTMKNSETMKKIKAIFAIVVISLFFAVSGAYAQATSPSDPPSGGPQAGDQPIGCGAPVGSGLAILLSLGAGYGAKKAYNYYKKDKEELES